MERGTLHTTPDLRQLHESEFDNLLHCGKPSNRDSSLDEVLILISSATAAILTFICQRTMSRRGWRMQDEIYVTYQLSPTSCHLVKPVR